MTGLDTNILLRYFLEDDPVQSPAAHPLVDSLTAANLGWIGIVTVLEFVWVLKSSTCASRTVIAAALDQLLTRDELIVENERLVAQAVRRFRDCSAEFADCLIAVSARDAGCTQIATFDRVAARDLDMTLIA